MHPSIRDLESIDNHTLLGRSQLRACLTENFHVSPELADWVVSTVQQRNEQLKRFFEQERKREMRENE
jgi:hypothetical protein